jgi:hypothetical protein
MCMCLVPNLGRTSTTHEPRQGHIEGTDLPTLSFVINSFALEVEDGTASTGRLVWGNESKISIFEAMRRGAESPDAVTEAAEWLADYLALMDGRAGSAQIKAAGRTAGHSYDSLKRARVKIGSLVESSRFPRRTPQGKPRTAVGAAVRASLRGDSLTALTALTALTVLVSRSWSSRGSPRARAPTDSESTPKDQVPRSILREESIDLRLASQDATRYTRERASARSLRSGGVHTALCTTC